MPQKPKGRREGSGEEFRFKIDAYSPATIPMLRLAEYMSQLALILGEPSHVHFRRLVKGSTAIVHVVEREAIPKVHDRVARVKEGDGPSEAMQAFAATNKMLRDDNAVATWKNGALLLRFPGREQAQEEFTSIRQHGFIDGVVIGVVGKDETAHIRLRSESRQISGCYTANRAVAKQLANRFWEAVRLFGNGKWRRDSDGAWTLDSFRVERFEPLDEAPLSTALATLRAIPTEWTDEAYGELQLLRSGTPKRKAGNGSH